MLIYFILLCISYAVNLFILHGVVSLFRVCIFLGVYYFFCNGGFSRVKSSLLSVGRIFLVDGKVEGRESSIFNISGPMKVASSNSFSYAHHYKIGEFYSNTSIKVVTKQSYTVECNSLGELHIEKVRSAFDSSLFNGKLVTHYTLLDSMDSRVRDVSCATWTAPLNKTNLLDIDFCTPDCFPDLWIRELLKKLGRVDCHIADPAIGSTTPFDNTHFPSEFSNGVSLNDVCSVFQYAPIRKSSIGGRYNVLFPLPVMEDISNSIQPNCKFFFSDLF